MRTIPENNGTIIQVTSCDDSTVLCEQLMIDQDEEVGSFLDNYGIQGRL